MTQANLSVYQKGAYYSGVKIFNKLPSDIKNVNDNITKFKTTLKNFYMRTHSTHWKSILSNNGTSLITSISKDVLNAE
jgi:hypothetical protein